MCSQSRVGFETAGWAKPARSGCSEWVLLRSQRSGGDRVPHNFSQQKSGTGLCALQRLAAQTLCMLHRARTRRLMMIRTEWRNS